MLGADLARALRVQRGDRVTLIAPQGQVTPAGLVPRLKQFRVVGIFSVGHYEYDSGLALVRMEDAQALYRMGDAASGVRLKLANLYEAPRVARELAKSVGTDAYVTDWTQQNANYFRAIQIEKRMMFIILTLIIAVAAFNLVSTLVMVVTDKHPDIAILRTLGASPASIMKIFMVQGTLIGVIGTALGVRPRRASCRSTSTWSSRRSSAPSTSRSSRARSTTSASCPRSSSGATSGPWPPWRSGSPSRPRSIRAGAPRA